MTLYWKNHAVIEAGPTTRYGARKPSLNASRIACCSCPLPDTCDEFMYSAIFSSGIPE
eukprot:CAMPEP_0119567384 /NCGR_PEP_ID=MMETSP1352-20130426/35790_1 /TAXON_ID=265584 /ORGANISM="Stauroneis constricta, Strain CCMP1120" /LENGTH=57 /DNA_ID=CAMNT_0007616637 /DNA_START=16 /DNA_END=186 /DNA_ORIENTATION=-